MWLKAEEGGRLGTTAAQGRKFNSAAPAAARKQAGQPISQFDAQIAAIVLANGGDLATRNVDDFKGCGVSVVNPWQA